MLLLSLFGCGDGSHPSASALVWQDIYIGPPPATSSSSAEDAAACSERLFVVGESFHSYILRAYDLADGALQWEENASLDSPITSRSVVCEGNRVYALGDVAPVPDTAFVRAYDAESGAVLWEFVVDSGGSNVGIELVAGDGEVFALTKSSDEDGSNVTMDAWSLDASTGGVLWHNRDTAADVPYAYGRFTVFDEQVCIVRDSGSSPLLRCLDRTSGDLLWYAADVGQPGVEVRSQADCRSDFAAFGRGEALAGFVAAYDPRDGRLLWVRDDFDAITDVHLFHGRVVVTGIDFDISSDPDEAHETRYFRVTGLDRRGHTDWEDLHIDEGVRTSVISDGKLFVAGEGGQARVYDPESGRLIAEQAPPGPPRNRGTWDMAAEGDRYALVGSTFRDDPGHHVNFSVRAYELAR